MTQEEIDNYNCLCAKFLGWVYNEQTNFWNEDMRHDFSFLEDYDLKFHSDWNWIMEVVEAIKNTTNPREHSDTTFSTLRFEIQTHLGRANKEAVIETINQFLIWYNENKTN
jgi:hypothetical protein